MIIFRFRLWLSKKIDPRKRVCFNLDLNTDVEKMADDIMKQMGGRK